MDPGVFEIRVQGVIDRLRRLSGLKESHEPDNHPEMHQEAPSPIANRNNQMAIVTTKIIAKKHFVIFHANDLTLFFLHSYKEDLLFSSLCRF